jgi:Uma2 family endonuclease
MLRSLTEARMPDPLHLEGWEEQDEPMATDWHHGEQDYCCAVLRERFAGPDCYVTRDRWLLMDPANQADKLLPDLLVALGVPDRNREEYNPLIEGKPPDLLAELLSKDTRRIDVEDKRERYAKLGVREYFVFNPERRFRLPRINGWTLHSDGSASPLPAGPDGSVASTVLPVRFVIREEYLAVLDQPSGVPLSPLAGAYLRLHEEEVARQRAEAEVERLRALLRQRDSND